MNRSSDITMTEAARHLDMHPLALSERIASLPASQRPHDIARPTSTKRHYRWPSLADVERWAMSNGIPLPEPPGLDTDDSPTRDPVIEAVTDLRADLDGSTADILDFLADWRAERNDDHPPVPGVAVFIGRALILAGIAAAVVGLAFGVAIAVGTAIGMGLLT